MKSEGDASLKKLLTAPDSAGIYDFLYVDRPRISALYAQLFPQGVLTNVKTSASESSSSDDSVGTDIKIFKADAKANTSAAEGIEHLFDASWSVPLEVLAELQKRSLIRDTPIGAGLGSIIACDSHMRVIEFSSMDNLWEPALKIFASTINATAAQPLAPDAIENVGNVLKAMPRTIHAHFLTAHARLWASLVPGNLTIPITDLTLKYGGTVSGVWKILYIFDSWSDALEPPDVGSYWSASELMDGLLTVMHSLRVFMGRPSGWLGITPLLIYRDIAGWIPVTNPQLTST